MNILRATLHDAQQIAGIYNYYIDNSVITFETEPVSAAEMEKRIQSKLERFEWLVLKDNEEITGYAYYGTFRDRAAYDATVESTIYLHPQHMGKGYGKLLYGELVQSAKNKGFKEIIGGIALPNDGSIKLHESLGFEKAGHFKNVGLKFDKWIDVAFWQKSLR
jgi:phosphinothricin acetyltransferase